MAIGSELKKRIDKQSKLLGEIAAQMHSLESDYRAAEAYLQALQDTFKLLPKEEQESEAAPEVTMRPGSLVAQARAALLKRGEAMHVNDLLKAMGREANKRGRLSLSGSLANYVRKEQIFTRPAPNIFGLREWMIKDNPGTPDDVNEGNVGIAETRPLPVRPLTHRPLN